MSQYTDLHHREQSTENALMLSALPSTSAETIVQRKPLIPNAAHAGTAIPVSNPQAVSKQRWFEILLRSLSFSIIWNGVCRIARRPRVELGKRAMHKNKLHLAMTLSTHLLPMAACGIILVYNIRGYYVGGELAGPKGEDDVKLNTLQFVAKLHELLMQASLSLIIVSFVRHELAVGRGVPFGAIFGSLQLSQLHYLWSKELIGTMKARTRSRWTKWSLIALLFIGAIQFVTVGPSSAILIRPRLDIWPAGGTAAWLDATRDQIWPGVFHERDVPPECATISSESSSECISKDWGLVRDSIIPLWEDFSLRQGTFPEYFTLPSKKALRALSLRTTIGTYPSNWTMATVQMSNLADLITDIGQLWINAAVGHRVISSLQYSKRFKFRRDAIYTIDNVYQPLTWVKCRAFRNTTDPYVSAGIIGPYKLDSFCNFTQGKAKEYIWQVYDNPVELPPILEHYNGNHSSPRLRFVDLPEDQFGYNSVGAFISFPDSWPKGKSIQACSIDARWALTRIRSRRSRIKFAEGEPFGWLGGTCTISKSKKIKISQGWANLLNPRIEEEDIDVFEKILQGLHLNVDGPWENDGKFTQPLMEQILSVLVTNGLAVNAASAEPPVPLKGCTPISCTNTCHDGDGAWCEEIMPKKVFGPGGNIYDLPPNFNASTASQYSVNITVDGYAYHSRGSTARLACAVLILYCLLALGHIFFSFWSGLSSHSWDTVAEVVALAMQSQPTAALKNTCAGIVSTTVFANLVSVAESGEDGEHLELIFEADHDYEVEAVSNKLQPDKFYF